MLGDPATCINRKQALQPPVHLTVHSTQTIMLNGSTNLGNNEVTASVT